MASSQDLRVWDLVARISVLLLTFGSTVIFFLDVLLWLWFIIMAAFFTTRRCISLMPRFLLSCQPVHSLSSSWWKKHQTSLELTEYLFQSPFLLKLNHWRLQSHALRCQENRAPLPNFVSFMELGPSLLSNRKTVLQRCNQKVIKWCL